MARRVDKIMNLLQEQSKLATEVKNQKANQLRPFRDEVIPAPSSSTIENHVDVIIVQNEDDGHPNNLPVDDIENYARETEEMLLNKISQGEPYIISDLADLDVTKETTNCSETAKLVSEEEILLVEQTLCQNKEMNEDPDYIMTEEEMEEETSNADAESESNEKRTFRKIMRFP